MRTKTSFSTRLRAFTLLELMAVVTIIGILASVAIPLVGKYLKKSKTTEAKANLRKIYDGEVAYYQEEHTLSTGALASKQFVSFSATPSSPGRNKQVANFDAQGWGAIKFSSDSPVWYSYSVAATGTGTASSFTARANGDIDGDGVTSLFERVGTIDNATGEVVGGAAIYSLDELE